MLLYVNLRMPEMVVACQEIDSLMKEPDDQKRASLSCIWCKERGTCDLSGYYVDSFRNHPLSHTTTNYARPDGDDIRRFRDIPDMGRDCEMRMMQLLSSG